MEQTVVWSVLGLYGSIVLLGIVLGSIMVSGFRKNAGADRIIGERISMQMAQTDGLVKEMARKTDEMSRKTDEMARKTDENSSVMAKVHEEMVKANKDNALFLRAIFERVDKQK